MKKGWIYRFTLTAGLLLLVGLGCKSDDEAMLAALTEPVRLEYWSVNHDSRSIRQLIDAYNLRKPYVTIRYRRFRPEEFEQALLEALAEDKGPDIMTLHNTWLGKYQTKLSPAPAAVQSAYVVVKGGAGLSSKKEITPVTTPIPNANQIDKLFVKAVKSDVVKNNSSGQPAVWGLPMALDTMVLYYNQDLLDQAGVAQAPTTWTELQDAIVATTRYHEDGSIAQAGAAIGTGSNVDRSADIIATLLLQSGVPMTDAAGRPAFHLEVEGSRDAPQVEALRFYTDFGNPTKQVYTYNENMESSLEAFTRGKAAFFFGYAYHTPHIKARAPKLNYRILPMPQLNPNVPKNIANYWVESVTKKSENADLAWDFINFMTTAAQADIYTKTQQLPTALRATINKQLEDPQLSTFASQALTSESWYKGRNPAVADAALEEMIDYIHENRALELDEDIFGDALARAASKINQSR